MAIPEIIEGAYRVVATSDLPPPPRRQVRPSPNRRRAAARIVAWNVIGVAAVVALPLLF
ncbi:hypothetical protein [Phenylobacterium sp.]|uniref:hypothetical protein n=1 Tax=Phenylobacterium sp. TaxID=1871053 RepID=UPI0025EC2B09|nr:hypothetical protein [Phenylobacterium sp.]